eukprot:188907-Pleurochrysis_carterae.AAC.1
MERNLVPVKAHNAGQAIFKCLESYPAQTATSLESYAPSSAATALSVDCCTIARLKCQVSKRMHESGEV